VRGRLLATYLWHALNSRATLLRIAGVAQLAAHLICNQGVGGSSPPASSTNQSRWPGVPPATCCYSDADAPLDGPRGVCSSAHRTSATTTGSAMFLSRNDPCEYTGTEEGAFAATCAVT
jgi:hypothetical protein